MHGSPPARSDSDAWDARYSEDAQIWSGNPNVALVDEVKTMVPGRALDVGCGEGADAIWLAQRGWEVTALDPSGVALARARRAAAIAGAAVGWLQGGLADVELAVGGFDLVSVFYPALLKSAASGPERKLQGLVAPGGTLLFVHHARIDREHALARGFDPDDYLSPEDMRAALGDDWAVVTKESRPREVAGGAGAHHHEDLVLRARKRP